MTFSEYVGEVTEAFHHTPNEWRHGQAAFNVLWRLRPDLSEQIRGRHHDIDPFYDDVRLPAFYEWVERNW